MKKRTRCVSLSEENDNLLRLIKAQKGVSCCRTINLLISLFCRIPADIRKELASFCQERICELDTASKTAGEFGYQEDLYYLHIYKALSDYFSGGVLPAVQSDFVANHAMQTVDMDRCTLLCPADYIIINKSCAKKSTHASVIELKNAGFGIPHFVYLADRPAASYSAHIKAVIHGLCAQEWPHFLELAQTATVQYFDIYRQGDPVYPADYAPPMGTLIVPDAE